MRIEYLFAIYCVLYQLQNHTFEQLLIKWLKNWFMLIGTENNDEMFKLSDIPLLE